MDMEFQTNFDRHCYCSLRSVLLCSAGLNLSVNAIHNIGVCVSAICSSKLNNINYSKLSVIVITTKHFLLLSSVINPPPRVSIGLSSQYNITASFLSLYLHLTGSTVLLQSKEVVR